MAASQTPTISTASSSNTSRQGIPSFKTWGVLGIALFVLGIISGKLYTSYSYIPALEMLLCYTAMVAFLGTGIVIARYILAIPQKLIKIPLMTVWVIALILYSALCFLFEVFVGNRYLEPFEYQGATYYCKDETLLLTFIYKVYRQDAPLTLTYLGEFVSDELALDAQPINETIAQEVLNNLRND